MRFTVDANGCWNFTGAIGDDGYGKISLGNKTYRTHRLMAHLTIKSLMSDDQIVAHKCDNPLCINPHHLFITTALGNMQDRDKKGHAYCGERTKWAKLKAHDILEIREKYSSGDSISKIAAKYPSVTCGCIQAIISRKSWKHI